MLTYRKRVLEMKALETLSFQFSSKMSVNRELHVSQNVEMSTFQNLENVSMNSHVVGQD